LRFSDQLCKDLVWGHEVEDFARSVVESFGDDVEIILAVPAEVGSLGQILADEAICIFVAAALPRAVGIAEPDFDPGVTVTLAINPKLITFSF
jgi:hypothetical protein